MFIIESLILGTTVIVVASLRFADKVHKRMHPEPKPEEEIDPVSGPEAKDPRVAALLYERKLMEKLATKATWETERDKATNRIKEITKELSKS